MNRFFCQMTFLILATTNMLLAAHKDGSWPLTSFTKTHFQEVWDGGPARAVCLVRGEKLHGTGVLVKVQGRSCVLTASHLGDGQCVTFLKPDQNSKDLKLDGISLPVRQVIHFVDERDRGSVQSDIQLLLLEGVPEIEPLELSIEAPSGVLSLYGFGMFFAEHTQGKPTFDAAGVKGGDGKFSIIHPAKIQSRDYEVSPRLGWLEVLSSRFVEFCGGSFSRLLQYYTIDKGFCAEAIIKHNLQYRPVQGETYTGLGFSGGPVINSDSNVVGINIAANAFSRGFYLNNSLLLTGGTVLMMFLHLSQKSWASYVGNPFLAVALRYFPRWFNYPLENASIFLAVLASNTVCISWYLYQYFLIPQNSGMQVSRRVTEELVEWLHRQVSEAKNSMLDTGGFLSK